MKSNRLCMFSTQDRDRGQRTCLDKLPLQNASLAKSPTRKVTAQTNQLFASLPAYTKLERFKFVHKMNHFALKSKIYFNALKQAWKEPENIKICEVAMSYQDKKPVPKLDEKPQLSKRFFSFAEVSGRLLPFLFLFAWDFWDVAEHWGLSPYNALMS